jgi:hypothetical protein
MTPELTQQHKDAAIRTILDGANYFDDTPFNLPVGWQYVEQSHGKVFAANEKEGLFLKGYKDPNWANSVYTCYKILQEKQFALPSNCPEILYPIALQGGVR